MRREPSTATEPAGPFTLPPLPYGERALAPIISARTVRFHYEKHHRGYVDKLNTLVVERGVAHLPLIELIWHTHGKPDQAEMFNNAAQAWNHSFYWQSLNPASRADESPNGTLAQMIESRFGGLDALKDELVSNAVAQFGSGWVWLVHGPRGLRVVRTGNAELPFTDGDVPLLTIDVWEHAYYLDYQHQREEHVKAITQLLNWTFAAENLIRLKDLTDAHRTPA